MLTQLLKSRKPATKALKYARTDLSFSKEGREGASLHSFPGPHLSWLYLYDDANVSSDQDRYRNYSGKCIDAKVQRPTHLHLCETFIGPRYTVHTGSGNQHTLDRKSPKNTKLETFLKLPCSTPVRTQTGCGIVGEDDDRCQDQLPSVSSKLTSPQLLIRIIPNAPAKARKKKKKKKKTTTTKSNGE